MPIFAYRCESCGFEKDVLQKRSDPPLEACPSCGQAAFRKQISAPAFQLKGSGWYVTDFRDGGKNKAADKADGKGEGSKPASEGSGTAGTAGTDSAAAKPAPAAPAPAPAAAAPSAPASGSKAP